MDDNVNGCYQRIDVSPIQDVAATVFNLLPAMGCGLKTAASHADNAPHLRTTLQGFDQRPADFPSRAGDCNREHHYTVAGQSGPAQRRGRSLGSILSRR